MAVSPPAHHFSPVEDNAVDLAPRFQAGVQPQRLILSLLGNYWRNDDADIPSAAVVEMLEAFGVTTASARVALSRLGRRGFLRVAKQGRNTSYRLTDMASGFLLDGRRRIFSFGVPSPPWDGQWRCVAFSVPEDDRRLRHLLRSRLRFAGYAPLYDGWWVSPNDRIDQAVRAIEDLGVAQATVFSSEVVPGSRTGGDPVSAWDLQRLRGQFESYIERFAPLIGQVRSGEVAATLATVRHFDMIDEWLVRSIDDPGLPDELLPSTWPRTEARAVFVELHDLLAPLAATHVRQVLAAHAPDLAPYVGHFTVDEVLSSLVRRSARRTARP